MQKPLVTLFTLGSLVILPSVQAQDAETLYTTKACVACHKIKTKMVGPSYEEIATRYAGQKDAVATLAEKIQKGSQGAWGQIPMPPSAVTEKEALTLAEWILNQK